MKTKRRSFVREIVVKYTCKREVESKKADSPEAVFNILKPLIEDEIKEHFIVVLLNNKNTVLCYEVVSIGTISESIVHPREVFRSAILKSASAVVLAHNHPSGELQPSREDIATTERIEKAGKIIGIEVLDHLILSSEDYLSMKEMGFLK
jgi:DNA repair protein RadC